MLDMIIFIFILCILYLIRWKYFSTSEYMTNIQSDIYGTYNQPYTIKNRFDKGDKPSKVWAGDSMLPYNSYLTQQETIGDNRLYYIDGNQHYYFEGDYKYYEKPIEDWIHME